MTSIELLKLLMKNFKYNENIMNYHFMINPSLVPVVDRDGNDMVNYKYNNFLNEVKRIFNENINNTAK